MADHDILVEVIGISASFYGEHIVEVHQLISGIPRAIAQIESLEVGIDNVHLTIPQLLSSPIDAANNIIFVRYGTTSSARLGAHWKTSAHLKVEKVFNEIFAKKLIAKKIG